MYHFFVRSWKLRHSVSYNGHLGCFPISFALHFFFWLAICWLFQWWEIHETMSQYIYPLGNSTWDFHSLDQGSSLIVIQKTYTELVIDDLDSLEDGTILNCLLICSCHWIIVLSLDHLSYNRHLGIPRTLAASPLANFYLAIWQPLSRKTSLWNTKLLRRR